MRLVQWAERPSMLDHAAVGLLWLLLCAALAYGANLDYLSVQTPDDAIYARRGVEMARSGNFFSVTWDGRPTTIYPNLQTWILAQSFNLFGENDFAAKLPSVIMALGVVAITFGIGRQLCGTPAGLAAASLMALTHLFFVHARRVMTDIPLTFWCSLAIWALLAGRKRPWLLILLGPPLAAALLTKSVLGLVPLWVAGALLLSPQYRSLLKSPWLWGGVALGLLLGASWSLHQGFFLGWKYVAYHYNEVLGRSSSAFDVLDFLFTYPVEALKHYQPLILPGLAGLGLFVLRRLKGEVKELELLFFWVAAPWLIYSLSSTKAPRYLFPVLPALAVFGGWYLTEYLPRWTRLACRYAIPALLLIICVLYWLTPLSLGKDRMMFYKQNLDSVRGWISTEHKLPYYGKHYYDPANPMLYYWEQSLNMSAQNAQEALEQMRAHPKGMLLVEDDLLPEMERLGVAFEEVMRYRGCIWLRLKKPDKKPQSGSQPQSSS